MKSSNSTRLCLPGALLVVVSAERGGCGVHDWLVEMGRRGENLFSRTGRGVFGSCLANVAIHSELSANQSVSLQCVRLGGVTLGTYVGASTWAPRCIIPWDEELG